MARNTIEHITRYARQEITQSTPIFEGSRIYYRAEETLYCVAAK